MKKQVIKKLADKSYSKGKLSEETVKTISGKLKRDDLKLYIKELKTLESKQSLLVTLPTEDGMEEVKRQLIKLYPDKKIVFGVDPTLIAGVRIEDYDNLYELSLKGFLEGAITKRND